MGAPGLVGPVVGWAPVRKVSGSGLQAHCWDGLLMRPWQEASVPAAWQSPQQRVQVPMVQVGRGGGAHMWPRLRGHSLPRLTSPRPASVDR